MRRLAAFIKPYRKESLLAPLFKLLEALFDLLVPLVVARMIDSGAAFTDNQTIYWCFGALLLMAAVGLLCSVTAQYFAAKASVGFAGRLRQALFDHVQSLSFSQLDRLGSDTLITRLSDDVNQVQNGVNMCLRLLLRSPFIVFGSMIMAFTIDLKCALIFTVTIPVLFAAVFLIMQASIPLFFKVQSRLDRVTALTRENLTGVRVIRAFCREEQSAAEFKEQNHALTRLNLFVGRISALLNPLTYAVINIAAVLLIRQSAFRVNIGALQQGQVVALYNYMLQISVELVKLAALIITLNKAAACAKRTASLLEVQPDMQYPEITKTEVEDTALSPAIEFENVSMTYPGAGAPSLSNISFSAMPGQTVGIIGGTGSGKTTLIHLIPRFYDVCNGSIRIFGKKATDYSKQELRRQIGIVPQRPALFAGTVRDNLRFGNENAEDDALWQALSVAQAETVVRDKPDNLDFWIEQDGRNFSGGQKQRLTIARALVKNPDVLILDDSSSALDYATDAALRKAVKELKKTTILVSQRIFCVQQADLILVLDNGKLVGQGSHDRLMQDCSVYREIYYSQFPADRPLKSEGESDEV
mgnify:CR=1 FL=1